MALPPPYKEMEKTVAELLEHHFVYQDYAKASQIKNEQIHVYKYFPPNIT